MGAIFGRIQRYFPIAIIVIGLAILIVDLVTLEPLKSKSILITLVIMMWACEHYYIPVDSNGFSLVLPILFAIPGIWDLQTAGLAVGLVTTIERTIFKRWQGEVPLYPFQFVIALTGSRLIADMIHRRISTGGSLSLSYFIWSFSFVTLFYLIKWLLDVLSKKERQVKKQIGWNFFIFVLSAFYCWLSLIMTHQDRGVFDELSYFFFYSPAVAVSLIISFISHLQRERHRLNSVFHITSLVNSGITEEDPVREVVLQLKNLMSIDASILWLTEKNQWDVFHRDGKVKQDLSLTPSLIQEFLQLHQVVEPKKGDVPPHFFQENIRTFIFAPLRVEGDLIGMWAVGSERQNAYSKSDFQTFVTLSYQIAAIAKTRRLVREKEKDKIFEERNRIAREIHDGLAQTLAGAVMNLQIVEKSVDKNPEEARQLVNKTILKLRTSLKQVRTSIYALRPHPSEKTGLIQAIQERVKIFQEEYPDLSVRFIVKGTEIPLSVVIETGIFDIFKEALKNIEKHSNATKITILVGYFKDTFCFFIKDNGVGFSLGESLFRAKSNQNFGIMNMNDLADRLSGNLNIESKKGKGTKITITVPYSTKKGV